MQRRVRRTPNTTEALTRCCQIPHLTTLVVCAAVVSVSLQLKDDTAIVKARDALNENRHLLKSMLVPRNAESSLAKADFKKAVSKFFTKSVPPDTVDISDVESTIRRHVDSVNAYISSDSSLEHIREVSQMWEVHSIEFPVIKIDEEGKNDPFRLAHDRVSAQISRDDSLHGLPISTRICNYSTTAGHHASWLRIDHFEKGVERYTILDRSPAGHVTLVVNYDDGHTAEYLLPFMANFRPVPIPDGFSDFHSWAPALDILWEEIRSMSPEEAIRFIGNKISSRSASVDIASFSIPKWIAISSGMVILAVLHFCIAAWIVAHSSNSSLRAVPLEAIRWTPLIPGSSGAIVVAASFIVAPFLASMCVVVFYYGLSASYGSTLVLLVSVCATSLSSASASCLLKIRQDSPAVCVAVRMAAWASMFVLMSLPGLVAAKYIIINPFGFDFDDPLVLFGWCVFPFAACVVGLLSLSACGISNVLGSRDFRVIGRDKLDHIVSDRAGNIVIFIVAVMFVVVAIYPIETVTPLDTDTWIFCLRILFVLWVFASWIGFYFLFIKICKCLDARSWRSEVVSTVRTSSRQES